MDEEVSQRFGTCRFFFFSIGAATIFFVFYFKVMVALTVVRIVSGLLEFCKGESVFEYEFGDSGAAERVQMGAAAGSRPMSWATDRM